jgi:hypothetical protein
LHQVFTQRTFERLGSMNLPIRMTVALNSRIWQLFALVLLACQRASPSDSEPSRCGPQVPPTAQHPISARPQALAGYYDLIQVHTQPAAGQTNFGRLHLVPIDSGSRASGSGGPARSLTGWLEIATGDSAWRSNVGSRDPKSPGVVLAGDHLRLGQPNLGGYTEHLTITAVAAEGFWGWWRAVPGFDVTMDAEARRVLPDPAGYFCALRLTARR